VLCIEIGGDDGNKAFDPVLVEAGGFDYFHVKSFLQVICTSSVAIRRLSHHHRRRCVKRLEKSHTTPQDPVLCKHGDVWFVKRGC
jgi:hypothetical protein